MNSETSARQSSAQPRRRILMVLGAAVVIALVTWLVTRGDDESDKATSAGSVQVGVPTVMSESDVRKFGRAQSTPVYWAGPLPDRRYEVTQTAAGRYFIRYLTPRADVGDAAPRFLTVGTYPGTNAYGALLTVGKRPTATSINTPSGALVVYDRERPTSVYFGFPKEKFQVEVYDPRSSRARRFVLEGRVQRLR